MDKSNSQPSFNPLTGVNRFREMFYLFLSRGFSKEVDKAFLQNTSEILTSLEDLSGFEEISQEQDIQRGKELLRSFFREIKQTEGEMVLRDLAKDYAALFLGVGEKTVSLCESVYQSRSGALFQDSYFEVKERYQEMGLEKSEDFPEPDDHLSVELVHMASLCRLSIDSIENNTGKQQYYLRSQKEFLKKHLLSWVPEFSLRLEEASHSKFYNSLAYLLNGYIKMDDNLLDSLYEEVNSFNQKPKP